MGRFYMAVGCLVLAAGTFSAASALHDERSVSVRGRALEGGENKINAPQVAAGNPGDANDNAGKRRGDDKGEAGSRDDGNRHDGSANEQAVRIERADDEGDDENNAGGDQGLGQHNVGLGQHKNPQSGNPDHAGGSGGQHGGNDQNNWAQHYGGNGHFGGNPQSSGDHTDGSWNTPERNGFDKQHGNNQHGGNLDGEHHNGKPVGDKNQQNTAVDRDTGEADHNVGNVASSKALQDAHEAHTTPPEGGNGEVFLFLAGAVFGGMLVFMIANWTHMYEHIKLRDGEVTVVAAGGDEEKGSKDPAGKSTPTVGGKHESWRKKDRGLPHREISDAPLELPLEGNGNLAPVGNCDFSAAGNPAAPDTHKHESWRRKDRGLPDEDFATSELPLDGVAGNLVPVENHERRGGLPHHPNSFSIT
eukprot:CAMPEP_0172537146 /NCGR_PEP_ID=MMETSP1067-20121228/8815_1 /TAXON_ID=265564 ORGANISM="Thalassiosira punctigera, Strain Tpunct2005C2" /NCGR_SAMPLE_ID=MMETSP1067 /ASSEMBLY_ACC=CAM_ASM_000444 /LENGTH=416 /DNA_ID=CAMNT_0013322387 /DNA_START=42 /DNA_END=1292 /DNA_ORIENTATION=+